MRERLSERPKEVYGKTLGIIGAGSITNMVIERAEGFGCDILVWTFDPEKHSEL
jgi:phosphoglycerate dehydrogenase-like enzyme